MSADSCRNAFSVSETFLSGFSGWQNSPRVRLSIETATKFHSPLSSNQEIDLDKLDNWVVVVKEEHDLNPKPCTLQQLEFGIEVRLVVASPRILFSL